MSKPVKSKLDQYAEQLAAMDAERKTLAEMQAWLKQEGCAVANSTLSSYLEGLRQAATQASILERITSGAQQCAAIEKQFAKNPAPGMETLVGLLRVFILNLSANSSVDPKLLSVAASLLQPVLKWNEMQLKQSALMLDREKFKESLRSKIQAGLDQILAEANNNPVIQAAVNQIQNATAKE